MKLAKYMLWDVEDSGELVLRSCGSQEKGDRGTIFALQLIVGRQLLDHERKQDGLAKDIRELAQEIVRNGTESKQESFWWTRTWNGGPMVRGVGRLWIFPSVKKFDLLGDRYKRGGNCEAGTKLALKKGMGSWFKEAQLDRSKPSVRSGHVKRW